MCVCVKGVCNRGGGGGGDGRFIPTAMKERTKWEDPRTGVSSRARARTLAGTMDVYVCVCVEVAASVCCGKWVALRECCSALVFRVRSIVKCFSPLA